MSLPEERIAGIISTVSEDETCGCGECCERCWEDCCATDEDVQALQDFREDLDYVLSECSYWGMVGLAGAAATWESKSG